MEGNINSENPSDNGVEADDVKRPGHRIRALRQWSADLTALAVLAFLAISATSLGFVPVVIYSHDLFIPLDGAWRVLNGQRPHADFGTYLGPVFYLIEAAGMVMAGTTAKGIAYASAMTSTVLAAWAYFVSRRRLRSGASITLTVFTFILSFAPLALGDPNPVWHTYAMEYTRWGISLMCILLVESVVSESGGYVGGLSTGMICALLLFLKVNLFVTALGLVGVSLFLCWNSRRLRGILIGFCLVVAPMIAYLRFDLTAIWRDLRMVAAGRGASLSVSRAISLMEPNWLTFVITMVLAAWIATESVSIRYRIKYHYPILCLTVFGAGTILLATNYQPSGMPLGAVFALICCSRLYSRWKQEPSSKSLVSIWLVFSAFGFIGYSMRIDILSIVHAVSLKQLSPAYPTVHFDAQALDGFVTFGPKEAPDRPVDGQWLTQYVNDGLALLRENTSVGDSVVSIDYVNPFSFALKRPPNEGGVVSLAYSDSYSDRLKPEAARFLGTAAVVMIPKWPTAVRWQFEATLRIYRPYIEQHFNKAAESRLWILEKRNEIP